jgi:hypothetical protein
MNDALSDVIALLQPRAVFSKCISGAVALVVSRSMAKMPKVACPRVAVRWRQERCTQGGLERRPYEYAAIPPHNAFDLFQRSADCGLKHFVGPPRRQQTCYMSRLV